MGLKKDGSSKVVITAIIGNSAVAIAKFLGWFFSGSPSMLAEAIHSAADTSNQCLLFVGIQHGKKGPSKLFPWGTGSARYVWNLVSAMGIFFVGFGVTTYHGISSLLSPASYDNSAVNTNILILTLAFLVEGYALLVAIREINSQRNHIKFLEFIKQSDDPTTIGVLFEDSIAVLGISIAFLCIWLSSITNSNIPDAIGSIFIGLLLGIMAIVLAYINGRLLIGSSAHSSKEDEIRSFLSTYPTIEKITGMTTVVLGSGQLHLSLEIEFHGEHLIDPRQIARDAEDIRRGNNPTPILVDTAERMVRVVGRMINNLEKDLYKRFPDIVAIELVVS